MVSARSPRPRKASAAPATPSRPSEAPPQALEAPPAADACLAVIVDTPQHSGLSGPLDYLGPALPPGTLVRVPLGARQVCGVVWPPEAGREAQACGGQDAARLKPVAEAWTALPPLPLPWLRLIAFAAQYYQRGLGEVALAALPPELRQLDGVQLQRRLKRLAKRRAAGAGQGGVGVAERQGGGHSTAAQAPAPGAAPPESSPGSDAAWLPQPAAAPAAARPDAGAGGMPPPPAAWPEPSPEQAAVLQELARHAGGTSLLFGATGSGKTEVYLREVQRTLAAGCQALVMVPEINLTPQLHGRFAERFGADRVVALHSALTPAQRLQHWLLAHTGAADVVLGTRLAVFTPLPRLGLIVVDEEHEPSYKQQEGARYSARDLAVMRGHIEGVPVILGSATPSLESWHNALPAADGGAGRYRLLRMPARIGGGALPAVRLLDMTREKAHPGADHDTPLAAPLLAAMAERAQRGEQSLVLLNRRGYAPVLSCGDCGWKSGCPHCSAWRVFHKVDRTLRCHHCGLSQRVPRACPDCGNLDIRPVGRGTERLEEQLAEALPGLRIGRIDADVTRLKGALEARLASVHAGDIDVLVGTQMVAKGHDFRRITLVAAVNPDSALYSADFRAPERLFSLLMQAGGRAGRDAQVAGRSELWIQTWNAVHPLYAALRAHDYEAFAASQLAERQMAGLPPYAHLALLRAEARTQEAAQAFLRAAADAGRALLGDEAALTLYPAVPTTVARVADVERAQMLVEAPQRAPLQRFLAAWLPQLHVLARQKIEGHRVLRWAVDVDPLEI
ncbi:MAG: primosomal protein N' [Burkholderiales bacterium]|nr:primosomal protein N' [Burkholderiales bacterium]